MAVSYNALDVPFPKIKRRLTTKWIYLAIEKNHKKVGDISYVFCSDEEILKINKQYLNHAYYTDIITFDYSEGDKLSGDLFISLDTVKSNSEKFKTNYNEELRRVMIHGILHLCGYEDNTPMKKKTLHLKEDELLELFNSQ